MKKRSDMKMIPQINKNSLINRSIIIGRAGRSDNEWNAGIASVNRRKEHEGMGMNGAQQSPRAAKDFFDSFFI